MNASGPRADAATAADAAPVDAAAPTRDAPLVPPAAMLDGRWRAVRYRSLWNNQVVEIDDTTALDQEFARRVNGVLIIEGNRLRLNVGMFGVHGPLMLLLSVGDVPWRHQLRATEGRWRTTANRFIFEETRVPAGDPLAFSFDDDGLLWLTVVEPGRGTDSFSLAFVRDPNPVRRDRLEMSARLWWRGEEAIPDTFAPLLFWDAPGIERPEQRLPAGPWTGSAARRSRAFTLNFVGPPEVMVQGRVGGIPVAIGYPSAYADNDRDNRFGPGDGPQLSSPLAIVWRGEGPAEALRGTAFEGFLPGYSLALPNWILIANPGTPVGLVPFDNTLLPTFSLWSNDDFDPEYRLAEFVL